MEQQLKLSNNTAKLHQMFGKKLYASKYSFISEICQNAVDSHRMAGQKEPVEVGIKIVSSHYVFYVKDRGLSFKDSEDFVNKVCTIMESGKSADKTSADDCPMGEHGIGSISVSAYSSEWKYEVVTPDKKKFHCKLKEVEGKGLTYSLEPEYDSEEEQGVLFEVMVKSNEITGLILGIKDKLCYFKDIMFKFDESLIRNDKSLLTINSDFKIFQSENFQISTLSRDNEMHVALDQYSYPIKWSLLGIPPIKLGIGLKFNMAEGLVADITRENLSHSDNYKEVILAKIEKVADWFVEKYNSTECAEEFTSIKVINESMNLDKHITVNNKAYIIRPLEVYTKIKPKEPTFKGVSDSRLLYRFVKVTNGGRNLFETKWEINHKGAKVTPRIWRTYSISKDILATKPINNILWKELRDNYKCSLIYVPKKIHLSKGDTNLCNLFLFPSRYDMKVKYKRTGVNIWREYVDQINIMWKSAMKDYFIDSESIAITPKISKARFVRRKSKVNVEDLEGEIGVKYSKECKRNGDWNCTFMEKIVEVKDLHKIPLFHVYANELKRRQLDVLFELTSKKTFDYATKKYIPEKVRISPCIITDRQQKHIKKLNLHNFMEIDEFFAGKHKLFGKMMTGWMIYNNLNISSSPVFKNKEVIRKYISSSFSEDLDKLEAYHRKFSCSLLAESKTFINSPVDMCMEGKLYDLEVWDTYKRVEKTIENFDFVEILAPHAADHLPNKEKAIKAMQDLSRQRKIKMDFKNYLLKETK